MAIETELETVERHLRDFKQFEYEERMLRQKYEKALEEINQIAVYYDGKGWALNPEKIGEIVVRALDK